MKREISACCLFFLMLSAILVACGGFVSTPTEVEKTPTEEPAKAPIEFVGGMPMDVVTLDPHKSVATGDDIVNPLVWEALVAMDSSGHWRGILVKSWQVSDDGLVWTFKLREGVKFHNGREMTSDDVVHSFERILNKATGATMYSVLSGKIGSIEAVDTYTVKFVLNKGAGTFLSEVGLNIRCAIIAKESVDSDGGITHPIGTGPFMFESWEPGVAWRAKRFNDYWGEVAKIDSVKFVPLSDEVARFAALQTGEVDWIKMVPLNKATKPAGDLVIHFVHNPNTFRLNFNANRPPFKDPRMRQAVAYALDKEEINKAIFFGLGQVHNQPFPPNTFLYLDVEDPYRSPHIDKARSLMVEAGYSNGCEVTALELSDWYKGYWELVGAQLEPIGIKINLEIVEPAQGVERLLKGDFDLFNQSQGSIFHWDRTFGYFERSSSSNWLVGGYHDDNVAKLLDGGRNTADLDEAKQIYTQILQKLQDDAAAVFILAEPDVQAWRTWVKDFEPNPVNGFLIGPDVGLNYATLNEKPSNKD